MNRGASVDTSDGRGVAREVRDEASIVTAPPAREPEGQPGAADDGRPATWFPAALPSPLAEPLQQPPPQQAYGHPDSFGHPDPFGQQPYRRQPYPGQPYGPQPYAPQPYAPQPYGPPSGYPEQPHPAFRPYPGGSAQPYPGVAAQPYPAGLRQPWPTPYQPVSTRRGRRLLIAAVAAVVAVAGANADDLLTAFRPRPHLDEHVGAVAIARPEDLPQPEVRGGRYPSAGFEEAGAPLGTPPPAPASTAYTFQDTQVGDSGQEVPVAWSPCRPMHVVVNDAGAPPGFVDQVLAAFGDLSVATGLAVTYDGLTDEVATADRPLFQPARYGDRWAPVVVGFTDDRTVGELAGDVAGLTVTHMVEARGESHIVTAEVFLDAETLGMPSQSGYPAYVAVLRHELGHVAGLDHVDDQSQLMYPWTTGVVTYQDGDRAGLARLGQGSCAPTI